MSSKTDVAIVGGGPAGCAAALTLARYTSRTVHLIEGSDYSAFRPGEGVTSALLPILDYLGVGASCQLDLAASEGTEAVWGDGAPAAHETIFSGMKGEWHLDRRHFDASLSEAARRAGARVLQDAVLRTIKPGGAGWRLSLGIGASTLVVEASQVIDATGKRARAARRLGARRSLLDRLVGVVSHTPKAPSYGRRTTLVESASNGWWYSAPLPSGGAVCAFMTDADILPAGRRAIRQAFEEGLWGTRHVHPRFFGARLSRPRVYPAQSQILEPCIGPGWCAAGDAAMSVDPLASLGIGHAFASGIQAAWVTHRRLSGDEELAHAYPADVALNFENYRRNWRSIYSAERRWADQPFWMRRQTPGERRRGDLRASR